jgi:hypothetical protein
MQFPVIVINRMASAKDNLSENKVLREVLWQVT